MTRAGQAGIPGERRARKIEGPFIPRRLEMMKAPAYSVLSLSAHRCLSRIEVEHMHHGGRENGQLPITYDQFEEYGVHRHAIGPALRELVALGFVEITEPGVAGNADQHAPNRFRLTYVAAGRARQTDEWRRVESVEEAEAIAKTARSAAGNPSRMACSETKTSAGFCRSPVSDSTTEAHLSGQDDEQFPSAGNHHYLYIHGG